jgi:hypothetical protein
MVTVVTIAPLERYGLEECCSWIFLLRWDRGDVVLPAAIIPRAAIRYMHVIAPPGGHERC